jgi:hypothetical protein
MSDISTLSKMSGLKLSPQVLADAMKKWHESPPNAETGNVIRTKIDEYLESNKALQVQKIKLEESHPVVRKRMSALDNAVYTIEKTLNRDRKKKNSTTRAEHQKQLEAAKDEAETYSDENFVASNYFPEYSFVEDGDDEPGDNGDTYMAETEEDKRLEDLMMKLKEKRDLAAKITHERWNSSEEEMKVAANIAHQLHRDYLRLAFRPGRGITTPTPIPRKLIDKSAPPSFIEKTAPLVEILGAKKAAEKAFVDNSTDETRNRLNETVKHLKDATTVFLEWAQDNLSCALAEGHDYTNYRFRDDKQPEPLLGGLVPDVEFTISQLNRLESQLKVVENPMTITPFLSHSAVVENMKNVEAYRGHLLAVYTSPGCYRLVSLSEQFFWTPSDLAADTSIHNAGNGRKRRLRGCKEAPRNEKIELLEKCLGIVGVAHKGYHSLNMKSARRHARRIGDCMIKVAWSDGVTTWETRTDWRSFRGKDVADWDIYSFAKEHDNGEIPRYIPRQRELLICSSSKGDSSGKRNTRKPGIMEYSDSEDDGTAPEDYSDWDE